MMLSAREPVLNLIFQPSVRGRESRLRKNLQSYFQQSPQFYRTVSSGPSSQWPWRLSGWTHGHPHHSLTLIKCCQLGPVSLLATQKETNKQTHPPLPFFVTVSVTGSEEVFLDRIAPLLLLVRSLKNVRAIPQTCNF